MCLHSNLSPKIEVGCYYKILQNYNCHFHYAHTVSRHVLAHVCGLLGPCFKTGHLKPLGYRCRGPRVPRSATRHSDQRMRSHTEREALCKNMRRLRKTEFTSNINQSKHSRSAPKPGVWLTLQLHRKSTLDSTRLVGCANPAKKKDPSACNTVVSGAYNPLFKVLCIFPSRYLFAIGLEKIFSFR